MCGGGAHRPRSAAGVSPERTRARISGSGAPAPPPARASRRAASEVPLHVVAERLQRRDVDDVGALLEPPSRRAQQPVERPEEGGERLPEPVGAAISGVRRRARWRPARGCAGVGVPKRSSNQRATSGEKATATSDS